MLHNVVRLASIVLLLCAAVGCQSDGNGDAQGGGSSGNAQQEISALLDEYNQALLDNDLATLDRIWADDLSFINLRGELLSKQNRMDNIRTGATALTAARVSDKRIRTYGDVAVATLRVDLEAQYSGQEGSGPFAVTTVWARPKGMWQMAAVQMTRIAP